MYISHFRFWIGYYVVFAEGGASQCSRTNNFLFNLFYDGGLEPMMRKSKKSDDVLAPLHDILKNFQTQAVQDFVDACNVGSLTESGFCSTVDDALAVITGVNVLVKRSVR